MKKNITNNWISKYKNGGPDSEELASLNKAKMKAKIALASEFGNPAARRMTMYQPSTYRFTGNEMINNEHIGVPAGETGTHFMSSMGNYVVPYIQKGASGKLEFNPNASPDDREAMRFDNPEDAAYFAEHYKEVAPMMRSFKRNGGDISIPDLTPNKWIMKYDVGGAVCGKGQVKIKDGDGYKCVSLDSEEYKNIYNKGIGSFYKFDNTSNKWVSSNQDDPNAVFVTNKDELPEVIVVGKVNKEKQNEKLKSFVGSVNMQQPTESTKVDSSIKTKELKEQEQQAINNWKKQNKNIYGNSNLTDDEILEKIKLTEDYNKKAEGNTVKEVDYNKTNQNVSTVPSWFDLNKSEGKAREKVREEKENWEKSVDEENRAKKAVDNDEEFTFPNGTKKKYSEMDKSEKAYVYSKAKIRPTASITNPTDYYAGSNIAEEYNPFSTASGWIGNFAEAPELTEESGSIMPWVGAIADPALTIGAVALGNPELSGSQLLRKKIFNPIKPIQDLAKFVVAAEEGQASKFLGKKITDKIRKGTAENINESIKQNPLSSINEGSDIKFAQVVNKKYGGINNWLNKYKKI